MKNLKSLATMVESCEEEFLKFDLEYQQVLPLSLSLSLGVIHMHTHLAPLIYSQVFSCADSGPSDKDCESSYCKHSCNSLHNVGNVR